MNLKLANLALVCCILSIFACSKDKSEPEPIKPKQVSKQNVLVENIGDDMPSLDPQQAGDNSSLRVIVDLFEGLVEYDLQSRIIPAGAQRWQISADGLTYTFYLRKNAKWTNGDPVTAQDYVYSLRRAVTPKTLTRYYANYFDPILNSKAIQAGKKSPDKLGVIAKSRYVLQINLEKPNITFIDALTLPAFMPVNKKTIDKYGTTWASSPGTIISNGSYKLSKWIHNGYAEVTKNPYYWNAKKVSILKAKFLMIQDVSTDLQNYSAGNLSMTYIKLPTNSIRWYKKKFPKQYYNYPVLSQTFYIFNIKKTKFKDIRVRKALSMVIDRKGLIKGLLQQGEQPSYLVVPEKIAKGAYADLIKDVPGYQWINQPLDQRIKIAKKLLKQAGYSQDKTLNITISFNSNDYNRNIALTLQALWNKVFDGVVVATVFNEDWKVYLDDLSKGNFDIARLAWMADFNQPNTYTERYTCSSNNNYGGYCNKKADKLYYKSIQTRDKHEFIKLQSQLIVKQTADYPIIALFNSPFTRLVQSYIKGFEPQQNVLGIHKTKQLSIRQS